ncbi:MAG: hypothetical protein M3483_04060, partial [Gemmatimonadota bacterium]|nr:hypothetical protein [Gemmatimonadota bacterium]
AGALVRSSYHAKEQAREVEAGGAGRITEILEADVPAPAEVMGPGGVVRVLGEVPGPRLVQLGSL